MRKREEIEESFKDIIVPAGSEKLNSTFLEILLDIRELLMENRNPTFIEAVAEARKKQQTLRREKIETSLKSA